MDLKRIAGSFGNQLIRPLLYSEILPAPKYVKGKRIKLSITTNGYLLDQFNLLREINRILKKDGQFVIDTPNVSSLTRRISFFLRGTPPYPRLEDFLFSETPFTGHFREYSPKDLTLMLKHSGFEIEKMELFNIGIRQKENLKGLVFLKCLPWLFPNFRNYIWCTVRPFL